MAKVKKTPKNVVNAKKTGKDKRDKQKSEISTRKDGKSTADSGVTQFDPNVNLASLFAPKPNSIKPVVFTTTVIQDQSALPAVEKTGSKKVGKLKNKDAAQIRIDAKAKFQNSSETEGSKKGTKTKKERLKAQRKSKQKVKKSEDEHSDSDDLENNTDTEAAQDSDSNNVEVGKPTEDTDPKPQKTFQELNQPKPKNEELEHRTIFIGNVPKQLVKDTKHQTLKKLFKPFGKIETIRYRSVTSAKPTVLKKVAAYRNEIHPNRSNVSAYIRFSSREEAELAVKDAKGMKLQDHHLIIDLADGSAAKKNNKKAVFIGNLQLNTNDDDLWNFFEDCGAVESVRIVRDQASGLGKGFGYVNFQEAASVELALNKNEEVLNGRPLRVTRVVKKLKKKKDLGAGPPSVARDAKSKKAKSVKVANDKSSNFTGDRMSEIGKLKRNAKKVNKGDLKKARIAKQLMGNGNGQLKGAKSTANKFNRTSTVKQPKSSAARKMHSRKRSENFKKKNVPSKTNKQNAPFKRYFSK